MSSLLLIIVRATFSSPAILAQSHALVDELLGVVALETVADRVLAADFQHTWPLDLIATSAIFALLQWKSCLLRA